MCQALSLTASDRPLNRLVADVIHQHFIVVNIYNRDRVLVAEARSPRFAAIENELAGIDKLAFPAADSRNFRKLSIANQSVLQVMLPLKDQSGGVSGYFQGFFVIEPIVLARLRQDMAITLAIVLCAVLLTTVAFYPVILALNRNVIRY